MQSLVFVVGLSASSGIIISEKASPRPSLKSFRDNYASVAKTCLAVGYVKGNCQSNRDRRNMIIAFDAKAKGGVQALRKGDIIMFGDVNLNIGGGYNAVKGIFIAPKSGVYIFDWTIMTNANKYAYTSLVVNGKRKSYNHCHNSGQYLMSCSKLAVVRMKAGDKAWIDSYSGTATVHPTYTSFSSFML